MRFERLKRRTEIRKGQLDIAPLIDVMFLLLIFFMLTSNFVLQPGIRVRLPRAVTSEVIDSGNVVVSVTSQDLTYLNYKPIQTAALRDLIQEAAQAGSSVMMSVMSAAKTSVSYSPTTLRLRTVTGGSGAPPPLAMSSPEEVSTAPLNDPGVDMGESSASSTS